MLLILFLPLFIHPCPPKAHRNAGLIEKEVGDLELKVKSGLEDGSLPFKTATKMIVETGDVSGLHASLSFSLYR